MDEVFWWMSLALDKHGAAFLEMVMHGRKREWTWLRTAKAVTLYGFFLYTPGKSSLCSPLSLYTRFWCTNELSS